MSRTISIPRHNPDCLAQTYRRMLPLTLVSSGTHGTSRLSPAAQAREAYRTCVRPPARDISTVGLECFMGEDILPADILRQRTFGKIGTRTHFPAHAEALDRLNPAKGIMNQESRPIVWTVLPLHHTLTRYGFSHRSNQFCQAGVMCGPLELWPSSVGTYSSLSPAPTNR